MVLDCLSMGDGAEDEVASVFVNCLKGYMKTIRAQYELLVTYVTHMEHPISSSDQI